MGRVAEVLSFERVTRDGVPLAEVKVDAGDGETSTVEHYGAPGDDSPPLPGDYAHLVESSGSGGEAALGYADVAAAGEADPGERRIYARDSDGAVVAVAWLKGTGSVTIENGSGSIELAANGDVTINGVVIDTSGNIVTPGDVTAGEVTPGIGVSLSTHVHTSATPGNPTSSPTPGT